MLLIVLFSSTHFSAWDKWGLFTGDFKEELNNDIIIQCLPEDPNAPKSSIELEQEYEMKFIVAGRAVYIPLYSVVIILFCFLMVLGMYLPIRHRNVDFKKPTLLEEEVLFTKPDETLLFEKTQNGFETSEWDLKDNQLKEGKIVEVSKPTPVSLDEETLWLKGEDLLWEIPVTSKILPKKTPGGEELLWEKREKTIQVPLEQKEVVVEIEEKVEKSSEEEEGESEGETEWETASETES